MTLPKRNIPMATESLPTIQYANGITKGKRSGEKRFGPLRGFHVERGKWAAFDAVMAEAQAEVLEISHRGGAEVKPHWFLGEQVLFWPLTIGPVAKTFIGCMRGANADRMAEAGIGAAWPKGGKSKMVVRGYIIITVGDERVTLLTQFTTHSTMTDALLAVMVDHLRVLKAADELAGKELGYFDLAMVLAVGEDKMVGSKATTEVAVLTSGHPAEMTRDYLLSIWRPKYLAEAIEADWPDTVEWAMGFRASVERDSQELPDEEYANA